MALQNLSLRNKHYQMVQIAVALSIIKETPSHLTPGEFARNLQKIICQQISGENEKNDGTVDSGTPNFQRTEANSETIACCESSQSNSSKKTPQDSRSYEGTWKVNNSDLKSVESNTKVSEGCSSGTMGPKLLDMNSSENKKWLETSTDILLKQKNVATLGPDKKKYLRKEAKISQINTIKDFVSQDWNQNMEELLLSKGNNSLDASVLPDFISGSSLFNSSVSSSRLEQPNLVASSPKNICSQYTVPICNEVIKQQKDKERVRNSYCNIMQSLSDRQQSCSFLQSHIYPQWLLKSGKYCKVPDVQLRPVLNISNSAESLSFGSLTNPDNWNIGHKSVLFKKFDKLNQGCAHDDFSTRNCVELLKGVIQETEDALRGAHLGIHPCWNASQNFIKKIHEWLHPENFEGNTKYMYTEFIMKMVNILCQYNPPAHAEQLPVTLDIWWATLKMVKTQLFCLCATPALWHSGGNLLVTVLISVSHTLFSQKMSGYNTVVVDHMAEVAQTVAEVLRKVIGFAYSLLKRNPQNPCSLGLGAKLHQDLPSVESGLSTVKPNYDWEKPDDMGNISTVNCSQGESSKHLVKTPDSKLNFEIMTKSSQVWKTRIQSALNSLVTEKTTDLSETSTFPCEYLFNDDSSALLAFDLPIAESHSSHLDISGSLTYPSLLNDPDIKCCLLRWGYLLQTECLPLIENSQIMLYYQVQDIISLVNISAQDIK